MGLDVLVIGAGQAGLAAAYHLAKRGLQFAVVDGCNRVGDSWRKRYASLTLFTPRFLSALPVLSVPGDPEGYATRDEFAAYLERYAAQFGAAVRTGTRIDRLERSDSGFIATGPEGTIEARRVIIATGAFKKPLVPGFAAALAAGVRQHTTETYVSPADVTGRVLIVGDGASGRDIAMDLAPGVPTILATGKPRRLLPERIFGRSTWWWLTKLGLLGARPDSAVGKIMQRSDPFPNRKRALSDLTQSGVEIKPRATAAAGSLITFADGSSAEVGTVIWAIGYHDSFDWIQVKDALDERGQPIHSEGVSPVPGLYFLGRPWMRNRGSALIMGAGADAEAITGRMA